MKYLSLCFLGLVLSFHQVSFADDLELDLPGEDVKQSEDSEPARPWEFKTSDFTLETRQFANDDDDETFENQRSLRYKFDIEKPINNGRIKILFSGRYDDQDPNRNQLWLEDVFLEKTLGGKYDLKIGYQVFNFSGMEAFNPLDQINARIFDVSIVNAEKMGEFGFGLSAEKLGGYLSFFLIPTPTRPILPGENSRINLPENLDTAVWMGSKDDEPNWDDHFLISWEGITRDWDTTIVIAKTIDRSRTIIGTDNYQITSGFAIPDGDSFSDFNTPYYFERYISGFNTVGNWGDDLLKFTLAHSYYLSETEIYTADQASTEDSDPENLRTPQDYTVVSLGWEHPMELSGGYTSSLIAEYQTMQFADGENTADLPLANDIFLAWRLNFNDINSKQLTFSAMYDLEGNQEGFIQVDYSQRFKEVFKINIGILEYMIPDDAPFAGYGIFRDTEHAYFNFTYYL